MRNGLDEGIDVEVLHRRGHDLVVVFHKLMRCLKLLHDLRGVGLVGLGEHQDFLGTGALDALGNPGVSPADRFGGINQKRNDVNVVELEQGAFVELGAQTVLGLMNTRRIDKDQLEARAVNHGAHAATSRLGHRRGDGDLFAIAGVEQRGLTGVGTTDQGHKAAVETGLHIAKAQRHLVLVTEGIELLVAHTLKRVEFLDLTERIGILDLIQNLVVQNLIGRLHIVGHGNPFLNKAKRVGKDQQAHDCGGDGKNVHGSGGDILGALRQRILGR